MDDQTYQGLTLDNIKGHVEHIEKHYSEKLSFTEKRLVALWHFYLNLKTVQQQKIDIESEKDIK